MDGTPPPPKYRASSKTLALAMLVLLHLTCFLGGFIAPNSATQHNRHLPWAPPTDLHFFDAEGRFHLRPFIHPLITEPLSQDRYQEDKTARAHLQLFFRGDPYKLLGVFQTDLHFIGVEPPARIFFLGTDNFGRDLFARLLVGGRISLLASFLATILALLVATFFGSLAGYYGGWPDALLMRLVELFLALPWLYLLLAMRAFLPLDMSAPQQLILLASSLGLLAWSRPARIMRGVVVSIRQQPFLAASRSLGAPDLHLLRSHVLPTATPLLATLALNLLPRLLLAEVALTFLGVGLSTSGLSWGTLLATLQSYHVASRYWWMYSPLGALVSLCALYQLSYSSSANKRP